MKRFRIPLLRLKIWFWGKLHTIARKVSSRAFVNQHGAEFDLRLSQLFKGGPMK